MKSIYLLIATITFSLFLNQSAFSEVSGVDTVMVLKTDRLLCLNSQGIVLKCYDISLGQNPVGHKVQEGDSKTPEGMYYITSKNPRSKYFLSFGISYPNKQDRKFAAKLGVDPGGHISIHGLPNDYSAVSEYLEYFNWEKVGEKYIGMVLSKIDWTQGCIALNNEDMQEVWDSVSLRTPIFIYP